MSRRTNIPLKVIDREYGRKPYMPTKNLSSKSVQRTVTGYNSMISTDTDKALWNEAAGKHSELKKPYDSNSYKGMEHFNESPNDRTPPTSDPSPIPIIPPDVSHPEIPVIDLPELVIPIVPPGDGGVPDPVPVTSMELSQFPSSATAGTRIVGIGKISGSTEDVWSWQVTTVYGSPQITNIGSGIFVKSIGSGFATVRITIDIPSDALGDFSIIASARGVPGGKRVGTSITLTVAEVEEEEATAGSIFFGETVSAPYGGYLSVTEDVDDFAMGALPFTVQTWFRITEQPSFRYFIMAQGDVNVYPDLRYIEFFYTANPYGQFTFGLTHPTPDRGLQGVDVRTSDLTIALNTWYHVALVRGVEGAGDFKIFVSGINVTGSVQYDPGVTPEWPTTGLPLYIGHDPISGGVIPLKGYLDDFSIEKNAALYTSDFTPSQELSPNDTTVLLISGDGTDGSEIFTDSTGRHTVTSRNGASISTTVSKF